MNRSFYIPIEQQQYLQYSLVTGGGEETFSRRRRQSGIAIKPTALVMISDRFATMFLEKIPWEKNSSFSACKLSHNKKAPIGTFFRWNAIASTDSRADSTSYPGKFLTIIQFPKTMRETITPFLLPNTVDSSTTNLTTFTVKRTRLGYLNWLTAYVFADSRDSNVFDVYPVLIHRHPIVAHCHCPKLSRQPIRTLVNKPQPSTNKIP